MGGASNDGVVFELARGSSTITVLLSFDGSERRRIRMPKPGHGRRRESLWHDRAGGASEDGTVFELATPEAEMVLPTAANPTLTTTPGGTRRAGQR